MKKKKKLKVGLLALLCFSFVSCNNNIENKIDEEHVALELDRGAVILNNTSNSSIYNLVDGIYKIVEDKRNIVEYNTNDTILYTEENKAIVEYKGKKIEINETTIINEKISPDGRYLLYFTGENALILKILDLEKEDYLEVKLEGSISGALVDWYGSEKIVFYGVNNNKENGLFVYNILNHSVDEIYKIQEGFVTYIKSFNSEVYICEKNFNDDIYLKRIDKDLNVTLLSETMTDIYDIQVTEKGIYILGRKINDNISIYEHKGEDFERSIYNFPSYINVDSNLSVTEEGEILFIGSNSSPKELSVYKYSDGSISTMSGTKGKYSFIKIN